MRNVTDPVVMGWLATLVLVITLPVMVVPSVSALPELLIPIFVFGRELGRGPL